ncbi:MAG: endonuclease/exonuclease/phosphatase family protein, partial [Bacteroidota bacterium]
IRLAFVDRTSGDRIPDQGSIEVQLSVPLPPAWSATPLDRRQPDDIRFTSYNVLGGGLSDPSRRAYFSRILAAVSPDVIGFQEVGNQSANDARAFVRSVLGGTDNEWFAHKEVGGLVVVSRFPVLRTYRIEGSSSSQANSAVLIDTSSRWGTPTLLINAHPPCCRNDNARQLEVDAVAAFVRDVKPGGALGWLEADTPILMLGDMNLVGEARQLGTLLNGDIVNAGRFGTAPLPDWDGSAMADLQPLIASLPRVFTWYSPGSSFHPGRLDFIIYTDSVIEPQNRFVLFTPAMTPDVLAAAGLEEDDTTLASDHLPVVGDFRVKERSGLSTDPDGSAALFQLNAYPNPARAQATIQLTAPEAGPVRVAITDALGRELAVLVNGPLHRGAHTLQWNRGLLPAGIYFVRVVNARGQLSVRPITFLP